MFKEYKTLVPFFRKYALQYAVGFAFLIGVDAIQLILPQLVKHAINTVASGEFSMETIFGIAGEILVLALVISSGRFLWRFFIHGSSRRIEAALRERLFGHLLTLSSSFYKSNKTGDLMARATNDMNAVRMASGMGFVTFIDGIFMSSAILIVMFSQNAKIAFFTIIPLPAITFLIVVFGAFIGKRFKAVQEAYSTLSDIVQETMAGIRVVKGFVRERHFGGKFADANDTYRSENMKLVNLFGFFFPFINFLAGITVMILLLAGGNAVLTGTLSAGDLVALAAYLDMLIWPMIGAGFTVNILQRGATSLKRINEILDTKPDIQSLPDAIHNADRWPLELRRLSFRYPDGETDALTDISFRIERGKTLGILGRTGSGKSTLLKILPRLLDPPPGMVFLGSHDIRDWNLEELRKTFGFVPQETFLFSDTVKTNITYASPGLDGGRIGRATAISTIERDLRDFPMGIETLVGEKGLTLSGGQKQRVAISRAVANDPEILVFDDSLSAVDAETEEKILAEIVRERRGKTTIIVSHRVSALKETDDIIVIDSGRIIQAGNHRQLMRDTTGFYSEIARLQEIERESGN